MDKIRFIFWEGMKALSLAFLGLLAAKASGSLWSRTEGSAPRHRVWIKGLLYSTILALAVLGARSVGYDTAAELYFWASQENLSQSQPAKAYNNALRAVRLRPGNLRYWRQLGMSKMLIGQFASFRDDLPVFEKLSGGTLDEEDAYRFVACHFYMADYDKAISMAQQLIRQNRSYAAPYVLLGLSYTAQKKYSEAERTFLAVLQIYPSHQAAVEGLAHVYFLMGNRARAVRVLDETAKYPFPPHARERFEALKALYAQ